MSDADNVTVRRRSTPNPTSTMTPSLGGLVSAGKTPGEIAHALDCSLDEAWDRIVAAGLGALIPADKRPRPLPTDADAGTPPPAAAATPATATAPLEAPPEPPTTAATGPSTPPAAASPPPATASATTTATATPPAAPSPTPTKAPMTADTKPADATTTTAPAPKKRGGRPKGSKNAPAAAQGAELSKADRKAMAVGKVYLAAEAAGVTVKELVALIAEGFGSE